MSCLINGINNIALINDCGFTLGGIKRLWIGNYVSGTYDSLSVSNGIVSSVGVGLKFSEVKFNRSATKFNEAYNYTTKKYEQSLELEIPKYDHNKREIIDALIKSKLIIIFQDNHGKYFMMGEKSGVYSNSYNATTDVYTGRSIYLFKFLVKSDWGLLGVSSDYINSSVTVEDCDILNTEYALSTTLSINQYYNCQVNDLTNYVDPTTIVATGATGIIGTGGTGGTGSVALSPTYSLYLTEYNEWIKYDESWTDTDVEYFTGIFMADYFTGYAVGQKRDNFDRYSSIYKTIDGGNSWNKINPTWGAASSFDIGEISSTFFISPTTGYVIGTQYNLPPSNGFVGKTTDGGSSFYRLGLNNFLPKKIKMVNSNLGFIVGQKTDFGEGAIYRTTDGGDTWDQYIETWNSDDVVRFLSVDFYDENNGLAVGNDIQYTGVIFRTTDGGVTWTKYNDSWDSFNDVFLFFDVEWISPTRAIAVGGTLNNNPSVYETNDGGVTWTKNSFNDSSINWVSEICAVDENNIWIGGYNLDNSISLFNSTDGGVTWTKYNSSWVSSDVKSITDMNFIGNIGYFCGDDISSTGVIYRYVPL